MSFPWYGTSRILGSDHARRAGRSRRRRTTLLLERCEDRVLLASLVSVNTAGTASGNNASAVATVSANGRFVVFTSEANDLAPNDTNLLTDVFVRDLVTGTTTLVSVNAAGTASGNLASAAPVISADGTTVAFTSAADDLVANDTNLLTDVFVRDLVAGTTTLVSVNAAGTASGNNASANPILSADGTTVAFTSQASDLVATDTNGVTDVFARRLVTGVTSLVSINAAGTDSGDAASASVAPRISDDGQVVAFTTSAGDLVANDTNLFSDVFVRNLVAGTTTLASINTAGTASGNNTSAAATLSADGTRVAFSSTASDLVTNDTNLLSDVFVRDLAAGTTTLASMNAAGTGSGNGTSANPTLSADGTTVAFTSTANNLGPNDSNLLTDVYARVLSAATTSLISANTTNTDAGNVASAAVTPGISADGRYVGFTSAARNLVANDTNLVLTDVFLRDRVAGTTTLASVNAAGIASGNNVSATTSLSADGRILAFTSEASDLVTNDFNNLTDVFAANLSGQFAVSPPGNVDEGAGTATITVTRTGGAVGTVTVDFATSNGTATAGTDYTASIGTLTFLPGQTSQTIIVPILADALDEPNETLGIALANPTGGATLGTPGSGVLTILDNDPTPTISFTGGTGGGVGDTSAPEGTTAVFTVTLSAPSGRIITVDFATSGGTATSGADFTGASGTLTFLPGQTTQTIVVPTLVDGLVEPGETFVLSLGNATNATIADVQAVGTILDATQTPGGGGTQTPGGGGTQTPGGGGTQTPGGVTGALDPGSDSGVSNADGITNDNTPTFIGTAPPGSTVRIFAGPASGGSPVVIGQGVADGNGNYRITASPLPDGSYTITVSATDAAGLPIASSQILPGGGTGPLVIDTAGPRVVGSVLDPSTGRILVTYQDSGGGLDQRSLVNGGFYRVSRPFAPRPPRSVAVSGLSTTASTSPTGPQGVTMTLDGGRRVVHARFVLQILAGGVADAAGNALDGEFAGTFPSGNNRAGGDFAAQLDFDGRRVSPARGVSGLDAQRRSVLGRRRFGARSVRPLSMAAVREVALARADVSR